MAINGHCLCGNVKVEVADSEAPLNTMLCRCANCQSTASAAGSLVVIVDEKNVKITGNPKQYKDTNTTSGSAITRSFCGDCGSPIVTLSPNMAGKAVIKYGVFAQENAGKIPKPVAELYNCHRNTWEKAVEDAAQYEMMPSA